MVYEDMIDKKRVLAEFLELVAIPCSTHDERQIGDLLTKRLQELGGTVREDKAGEAIGGNCGNLVADFPATDGLEALPTVMLTAHMDCVEPCAGIHPVIEDGIIRSDGTTILGADDKAGVAEIMAAAEYLLENGGSHATLKIGFTPDEEIGRGADRFDVKGFGADYAYTADGGPVGELEYENFNAASAKAEFRGLNIHPGSAKDKMVNSQLIAMEFQSLLPVQQRPEYTEGYEGFIHLTDMEGQVEHSVLRYIVRDHDMEKFQAKKAVLRAAAEFINRKYGEGTVELTIRDSYFNMKKCIEPCMYVVDRAMEAMKAVGMEPRAVPIRGGTDGARLSYEGLPCPNLCTGGENYHGRFEYIPVEDMEQCVRMLVRILTDAGK